MMLYTYYATVYSAIQDVIEPSLLATAMAIYFCAMYALGGALGTPVIWHLSDHFTRSAAIAESPSLELDNLDRDQLHKALEPYRPEGLHAAMYALPVATLLLSLSLFAAARTVGRDMEKLQRWMRESSAVAETTRTKLQKVAT